MDLDKAMLDPTSVFGTPEDVVRQPNLSREEKISVLKRWEYDARELQVADEENMGGGPPDLLDRVLGVLRELDAAGQPSAVPPTKQGGC